MSFAGGWKNCRIFVKCLLKNKRGVNTGDMGVCLRLAHVTCLTYPEFVEGCLKVLSV